MPSFGPFELLAILFIVLLILGPSRLPNLANALGRSLREFRTAATEIESARRLEPVVAQRPDTTPTEPLPTQAPAPGNGAFQSRSLPPS